jgi:hypothetical protein
MSGDSANSATFEKFSIKKKELKIKIHILSKKRNAKSWPYEKSYNQNTHLQKKQKTLHRLYQ